MCASLRQSACLCVVVLSTCASTLSTEAETIFVDASATGAAHDGSNWCNGYLNLQDALTAASFGDEVRVANGDYKPDQGETVTVGNRLASFKLRSGVAIRGGYAGCGASHPDARDTTLYETILSGDLAQNDAADFQNRFDNSYHVVTYDDPGATGSILEGFTVRGGHANGTGPAGTATNQGPGIHIRLDSQKCIPGGPTIRNCIIEDNWSADHGAINVHADQTLIENCTIRNNHSNNRGGGLLIQSGNATVRNCLIIGNQAVFNGGGVWTGHSGDSTCAPTSSPVFDNCTIQDNSCENRGGGLFDDGSNIVVRDSFFIGNSARVHGGGAWFGPRVDVEDTSASQPLITDTLFEGNFTMEEGYSEGGGAHFLENQPTFLRCTFRDNVSAKNGGGLWGGGTNAVALLDSCVWEGNTGANGGGYYHRGTNSRTTVRDALFRDNHATEGGGGMTIYSGAGQIERTVFEFNIATLFGGGTFVQQDFDFTTCTGEACITRYEDCIIRNNEAKFGGGIHAGYSPHLIMRRVIIENNRADIGGGGYFKGREGNVPKGTPEAGWMRLEDCVFRDNVADGHEGGGAVVTGSATFAAIRTDFIRNTSLLYGAGMHVNTQSCADVYNCRFIGNFFIQDGYGAGIATTNSELRVANSLFIGNRGANNGGAVAVMGDSVATIVNSTIAHNESTTNGAAVFAGLGSTQVHNSIIWNNGAIALIPENAPGTLAISTSLIEGGFEGVGNFDADPQFINPAGLDGIVGTEDDNLLLLFTSPALNVGDLAALPPDEYDMDGDGDTSEPIPSDLAGEQRVTGSGLDLGAYEMGVVFCQPGAFSATGEEPCDPCPAGEFQPEAAGKECFPCNPGSFAAMPGSTLCNPCPAETFQPSMGAAECVACNCDDNNICTTNDCNAIAGDCENEAIGDCIPAASTWSLICLALLLLCAGTIRIPRAVGCVR